MVLPFFAFCYHVFVALTSKIKIQCGSDKTVHVLKEARPVVFSFWYEHVYFLLHFFKSRSIPVLLTPRGRDDILTAVATFAKLQFAKGTSEGGGRHALVTLAEELKNGRSIAIPASGPQTPERHNERHCKSGCFILAQEKQVPVVPISWKSRFSLKLKMGGGFMHVPLPFNSITILLGDPIVVPQHAEYGDLETLKTNLAKQLDTL